MPHQIFISYAWKPSRAHAVKLYQALGGDTVKGLVFLDSEDVNLGDSVPESIVNELWAARVVVIFPEPVYFTRQYCLQEHHIAVAAFLKALDVPGPEREEDLLSHVVLAFPSGETPSPLSRFHFDLQHTRWASAEEPDKLASFVLDRLASCTRTIGEKLEAVGAEYVRDQILNEALLPPHTGLPIGPIVPWDLRPSIGTGFWGRGDELWQIDYLLATRAGASGSTSAPTAVMDGFGGVGKTRLALEYLHRFGPTSFPGGRFWIDAEVDEDSLERRLHQILRSLNPQAPSLASYRQPGTQMSVKEDLSVAARALPADMKALFVLDNVPEPLAGELPKHPSAWCPVIGIAPVLATSRMRLDIASEAAAVRISVGVLRSDAGVQMLTQGVNRQILPDEQWHDIVHWVGGLPLALELLRALLQTGAMTASELVECSRTRGITTALDQGMEAIRRALPAGCLRGISDAFSVSYSRLDAAAQRTARLVAWLGPEPVPDALLAAVPDRPFTSQTLATLRSRSFIVPTPPGNVPVRGLMHRVLSDFLRTQSPNPADEVRQLITAMENLLTDELCENPLEAPLVDLLISHAQALAASSSVVSSADHATLHFVLGNALLRYGARDLSTVRISESIDVFGASRVEWDENPCLWNQTKTRHAGALSDLAYRQGDSERHRQAVRMFRMVLEKASERQANVDVAAARGNLSIALQRQGELDSTPEYVQLAVQEQSVALAGIDRKVTPGAWAKAQHDLGSARARLGILQHDLGEMRLALGAFQLALVEKPGDLLTQQNLSRTLYDTAMLMHRGDSERIALLQQAVGISRSLSEESMAEFPSERGGRLTNFGQGLLELAKETNDTPLLTEAVENFRTALTCRTEEGSPLGRVTTLRYFGEALLLLAIREQRRSQLLAAIEVFDEACAILDQILGACEDDNEAARRYAAYRSIYDLRDQARALAAGRAFDTLR